MRLQGIMLVVFIILVWIFILVNTTTMITCRGVSWKELAVAILQNGQTSQKAHVRDLTPS